MTQSSQTFTDVLSDSLAILQAASLRKTQSRVELLKALIAQHGPFSVEELHQQVKFKKVDLATVYRCLTVFESVGLVKRCDFGDGVARYEIHHGSSHHHHHVICKICRKSENIDDCEVQRLEQLVLSKGYSQITHYLEFFGICQKCS